MNPPSVSSGSRSSPARLLAGEDAGEHLDPVVHVPLARASVGTYMSSSTARGGLADKAVRKDVSAHIT